MRVKEIKYKCDQCKKLVKDSHISFRFYHGEAHGWAIKQDDGMWETQNMGLYDRLHFCDGDCLGNFFNKSNPNI